MQVAHIAFTYLRLILIYWECEILVKILESVLDSALAPRGKEGDIPREKV